MQDKYAIDATQEILDGIAAGRLTLGRSHQVEGGLSPNVYNEDGELVGHVVLRPLEERAHRSESSSSAAVAGRHQDVPEMSRTGRVLLRVAEEAVPILMEVFAEAVRERRSRRATEVLRSGLDEGTLRLVVDNTGRPPVQETG